MTGLRSRWIQGLIVVAFAGVVVVPLVPGADRDDADIRLCGAGDLAPFGAALQSAAPAGLTVDWSNGKADERLDDLRRGHCDAVLAGYDPTPSERVGLGDAVVARDAIVILVDENSYEGGVIRMGNPVARSEPLRGLRRDELRGLLRVYSDPREQRWQWPGKYERWDTYIGATGRFVKVGRGGVTLKGWRRQPAGLLVQQMLEPGRFDTQTALYRGLGLDDRVLAGDWPEFTQPGLAREEELLAEVYRDATAFAAGQGDFRFALAFASLRVARLALRHVPVRVVAIDGIDPVVDVAAVDDGRYPLGRRIHLLTRQGEGERAARLAAWLVAPDGQRLVGDSGYLGLLAQGGATAVPLGE